MPIDVAITNPPVAASPRANHRYIGFECVASNPDINTNQSFSLPAGAFIRNLYGNIDFFFGAAGRIICTFTANSDDSIILAKFVCAGAANSAHHLEFNRAVNTLVTGSTGKVSLAFDFDGTGQQIIESQGIINLDPP
jgi:hypothetical protein